MENPPLVFVGIVTYNSARHIKACIESVYAQKDVEVQISVWDNDSQDETVSILQEHYPDVIVYDRKENLGFGEGHNRLMNSRLWDYYLCLNPDVTLDPQFVINAQSELERDPKNAAINGLTLYEKDAYEDETVFSLGHLYSQERRIESLGIGKKGSSIQYTSRKVFGPNGACPLFARKPLDQIRLKGEYYFEPEFFMYCEDEELGWRLKRNGFHTISLPKARAYHVGGGSNPMSNPKAVRDSIANRYLSLLRHDDPILFLKSSPYFLLVESAFLVINSLKRPSFFLAYLKAIAKFLRHSKAFYDSRAEQTKVGRTQMATWFSPFDSHRLKSLVQRHRVRKNPHSIYTKDASKSAAN